MDSQSDTRNFDSRYAALEHLRTALAAGRDWPEALLEAMALWTVPKEIHLGRTFDYFIAGEAFDWLLLAERLLNEVKDYVSEEEREALLTIGAFPDRFDDEEVARLLDGDKYRGYLNYYYGVTVEEALQLACELEARKRDASNGVRYRDDYLDRAFMRIYGKSSLELLLAFRASAEPNHQCISSMAEHRGFTYWLFKYRWANSDKAKIASDTAKGLRQLERIRKDVQRKQKMAAAARA